MAVLMRSLYIRTLQNPKCPSAQHIFTIIDTVYLDEILLLVKVYIHVN